MSENSLHEIQRRQGGTFVDADTDRARSLPFAPPDPSRAVHFGDAGAEFWAAREAAAVFDVSERAQIALTGADRSKFLHNFCTADVKALAAGQGSEAFVTNVKGRVLGHVFVFAEEDALIIETVAASESALLAHLERYIITEDVQLASRTAGFAELYLSGPSAAGALEERGLGGDDLAINSHRSPRPGISVRRVDWFNVPGFLLSVPRGELADWWSIFGVPGFLLSEPLEELADWWGCSIKDVATPAGAHAFHALRIAARFPLYGVDISDERIAQEVARTEQAISFRKGCYLGQEPIARIDALGHVNRELRGLTLDAGPLPQPEAAIVDDAGKEIGFVTSAAVRPDSGRVLALGYVRRPHNAPGSPVQIRIGDDSRAATVY